MDNSEISRFLAIGILRLAHTLQIVNLVAAIPGDLNIRRLDRPFIVSDAVANG